MSDSMDVNLIKKTLRKEISARRNQLSVCEMDELSQEIFKQVLSLNVLSSDKKVLTYVSYKSEVRTNNIIEYCLCHNIDVYTPKVIEDHMDFYKISSYGELKSGAYGILEPITSDKYKSNKRINHIMNDIIIMPGLVFDTNGGRIGYGGGYYDRYLCTHIHLLKIAVCYDFQLIESGIIPKDQYDISPDIIVTDKRILNF